MILRNYRDNWLRKQADGAKLVTEYYNIAPLIVSKLKQSKNYASYCETLLSNYINPCIELIRQGKNNECKEKYIDMVNYAKEIVKDEG